jgi:NAD(P)-dependent dehydrogenase (short-subunit alcohol dehydrogenase family)
VGQALNGQVLVVTGAGSGIGRATALRCLREGARVVAGDVNATAGDHLRRIAEHEGLGGRIEVRPADVTIEEDVAALVEHARIAFGDFHGIVNNAGLPGAVGRLVELRSEDWDQPMAVLTRGPLFGTKHGRADRVLDLEGRSAEYDARLCSRAGALQNQGQRSEPGDDRDSLTSPDADRGRAEFARLQPWPEAGDADAVAGCVVFLASEDSRFVTGHNLVVDGGASIDIGMSARLRGPDATAPEPGFNPGTSITR